MKILSKIGIFLLLAFLLLCLVCIVVPIGAAFAYILTGWTGSEELVQRLAIGFFVGLGCFVLTIAVTVFILE